MKRAPLVGLRGGVGCVLTIGHDMFPVVVGKDLPGKTLNPKPKKGELE